MTATLHPFVPTRERRAARRVFATYTELPPQKRDALLEQLVSIVGRAGTLRLLTLAEHDDGPETAA